MELSVIERIALLSILPAEGDITTLRIVQNLRNALSFSEEEFKDFEIMSTDGGIRWNRSKEVPKEITIGVKARSIIEDSLEKLNREKRLRADFIPLYDKFLGEETE